MDIFIYGLVTGSILLICALGFSMTLKTEGFINVAHGQMLMLGAYFTLGLTYIGITFFSSCHFECAFMRFYRTRFSKNVI